MRHLLQIIWLIFLIVSCKQNPKAVVIGDDNNRLFVLFDKLEHQYNSVPPDIDALYALSKEVKDLSDNYNGNNHKKFPEIYKRCADVFRSHSAQFCGSNGSPLLHCKDSSAIIDCYIKSARFYKKNNDTTSEGYTDAIYQLADVYDQLRKSSLALPLRLEYVKIIRKRKGDSSDMTADAFMFMGFTYELLNEFSLANNCYQKELEIREGLKKEDIQIVRERISDFQKKHNLQ